MQNGESTKLPDLPPSNHSFWKGARTFKKEMGKTKPCEHYFEHRVGREVVCKKCNIGFYFTGKEYLKDGQIEIRVG